MNLTVWLGFFIGYMAGSVPFGLIFSKWIAGVDPRKAGSRNIGFTNVLRVAGRGPGLLTLLGDWGKGYLGVWFAQWLSMDNTWVWLIGLTVLVGHNYSIFLGFKGGKGVATGLGILYRIEPLLGWIMVVIWAGTVWLWRYSSLGAIMAFGFLPFLVLFLHPVPSIVGFSLALSGLILVKHTANLQRLWSGTEPKIGQ